MKRFGKRPAQPPGTEPAGQAAAPALEVSAVTKRFGRTTALHNISMTVHRGEAVAIVGENGAGKSTLLRLCAGLETPDEGSVRASVRVGYCPQEPALFDLLTAAEHLALFGASRGQGPDVTAESRHMLTELGFPVSARQLVRDLSGGGRQKLNLALALLADPGLLLLDEPYQGFDHGSYLDFWSLTERWREQGRAVVVVTHLLTELDRVDTVIELPSQKLGD
jgi:ABC-type multidrug transport system ATPase subunit